MNFHFATCDRSRALSFIQQVYPSREIEDTPDSAGPLLDFVEKDVVRIQDPMMHGSAIEVIPGNAWAEDAELRAEVIKACKLVHDKD